MDAPTPAAPSTQGGGFASLKGLGAFHTQRDLAPARAGTPVVPETANRPEHGNPGLLDEEEGARAGFLQTLTDGYPPR